jgi:hypothetical protein
MKFTTFSQLSDAGLETPDIFSGYSGKYGEFGKMSG